MYGWVRPSLAIMNGPKKPGTRVIEDATLALGANVDGRARPDPWGDMSFSSLGSGKIIGHLDWEGHVLSETPTFRKRSRQELSELPKWSKTFWMNELDSVEMLLGIHQFEDVNKRFC